jgi:pilus assembly protein Flp/PilA
LQLNKSLSILKLNLGRNPEIHTTEGGEKIMLYSPKEKGQGLVEYALIIALIAILLIVVLGLVTGALSGVFSTISSALGLEGTGT